MRLAIIAFLSLACWQHAALAYEGKGSNPGDWKMFPVSLSEKADAYDLRLRNLDLFPKLCSLRVSHQGKVLLSDDRLHFKADRSLNVELKRDPAESYELKDLQYNMACVKLADEEPLESVPTPATLACDLSQEDCQQLCPAQVGQVDSCENDHLFLDFSRQSYQTKETATEWQASGLVHSQSKQTLYCQVLMTALVKGPLPGDKSLIVAPSKILPIKADESLKVSWSFDKFEAGAGRELDLRRPRVAALCSTKKPVDDSDWYQSCHPLKRHECNWILMKD